MIAPAVRAGYGFAAAALMLALAACAGTNTADKSPGADTGSRPYQGQYKIGKPYQIKGVWYYPHIDYNYDEVGVASWYGPGFHGEQTANGETYDMNGLTAAHKTLPLPSIVRVTNLENGRTVELRVNDRGPFVGDRIIDVSRSAAQLLGFHRAGTAMVRVQIEPEESQQLAAALTGAPVVIGAAAMPPATYAPPAAMQPVAPTETTLAANDAPAATDSSDGLSSIPVAMAGSGGNDALPPTIIGETAPPVVIATAPQAAPAAVQPTVPAAIPAAAPAPVSPPPARFVQAGAFADPVNVAKARAKLVPLGPVQVKPLSVDGQELVRVRVGPLGSDEEAQRVLVAALRAGFPGSHLVLE